MKKTLLTSVSALALSSPAFAHHGPAHTSGGDTNIALLLGAAALLAAIVGTLWFASRKRRKANQEEA